MSQLGNEQAPGQQVGLGVSFKRAYVPGMLCFMNPLLHSHCFEACQQCCCHATSACMKCCSSDSNGLCQTQSLHHSQSRAKLATIQSSSNSVTVTVLVGQNASKLLYSRDGLLLQSCKRILQCPCSLCTRCIFLNRIVLSSAPQGLSCTCFHAACQYSNSNGICPLGLCMQIRRQLGQI